MRNITLNILLYRRRAGLTQAQLAARLGVTPNTIANYENGKTTPPMETVIRIAHILNISTDQLFDTNIH